VLSVLVNSTLSTGGHGTLHLPGFGWKAGSPQEIRLSSNEQLSTTPVPWIESPYPKSPYDLRKINRITAERLWLEADDRTIPIDYPDESPSDNEEDEFTDRDIGVYELAPEGSTDDPNMMLVSIEQDPFNESVRVSTEDMSEGLEQEHDRRYVFFHPDVDPFAVSPYSELHEHYADDLYSLVTGLSPYPLAYPELVDMNNYTTKPQE
jgi:hypothetical protein